MPDFKNRLAGYTYALMRIFTGLLFLWHGTQKLFSFPLDAREGTPAHITYGAGSIELLGGILVAFGFLTRPAAFICSGLMAAAYWMAHGRKPFLPPVSDLDLAARAKEFFPMVNGGELAVLYCFVFLFISMQGSGPWGVDGLLRGRKAV